ncbi:MAG TPA: ABC transporter permease, partial [Methylomirabilota bacterium]
MLTLVMRRIVRLAVVLTGVSLVTFAILHASGDPVSLMMPEAPDADRALLRQAMGFNEPLAVQFVRFVRNIVRGDFGHSFFHRAPALPIVLHRMPTTLLLTVLAMVLSLSVAVPVGI